MRKERLFGAIGLGLFFLFPLVSLLQLRDSDDAWRAVASRTRASVLLVQSDDASTLCSAVVLQASPTRAVIAGRPPEAALHSVTPAGRIEWRTRWVDPNGEFTVLESDVLVVGAAAGSAPAPTLSALVALDTAALASVEHAGDDRPVAAVLVSPARLDAGPLWVGELQAGRDGDGRTHYLGARLRPVRDAAGVAAASAEGSEPAPAIDPRLAGAPFVTRDGVVLALYSGENLGAPSAVPISIVRDAVAALDLRTAN